MASGSTILVDATITVIDVDDPGKVTLDHLQPAEGVEFTATVSDEDDHTGLDRYPQQRHRMEMGEVPERHVRLGRHHR